MSNRETTNCTGCGASVEIVPAGISKKTNQPYGSFWKCKACGANGQVGPQPARQTRPATSPATKNDNLALLLKHMDDRFDVIEEKINNLGVLRITPEKPKDIDLPF